MGGDPWGEEGGRAGGQTWGRQCGVCVWSGVTWHRVQQAATVQRKELLCDIGTLQRERAVNCAQTF